jgi:hypothetical protein
MAALRAEGRPLRVASRGGQAREAPPCASLPQVVGCGASLAGCKGYFLRHRVCEEHSKAPVLLLRGGPGLGPCRLCQQCSKFHHVLAFEGVKRTCRVQLDRIRINKRARRSRAAINAAFAAAEAATAAFDAAGGALLLAGAGEDGEAPALPAAAVAAASCLTAGPAAVAALRVKRPAADSSGGDSWPCSRQPKARALAAPLAASSAADPAARSSVCGTAPQLGRGRDGLAALPGGAELGGFVSGLGGLAQVRAHALLAAPLSASASAAEARGLAGLLARGPADDSPQLLPPLGGSAALSGVAGATPSSGVAGAMGVAAAAAAATAAVAAETEAEAGAQRSFPETCAPPPPASPHGGASCGSVGLGLGVAGRGSLSGGPGGLLRAFTSEAAAAGGGGGGSETWLRPSPPAHGSSSGSPPSASAGETGLAAAVAAGGEPQPQPPVQLHPLLQQQLAAEVRAAMGSRAAPRTHAMQPAFQQAHAGQQQQQPQQHPCGVALQAVDAAVAARWAAGGGGSYDELRACEPGAAPQLPHSAALSDVALLPSIGASGGVASGGGGLGGGGLGGGGLGGGGLGGVLLQAWLSEDSEGGQARALGGQAAAPVMSSTGGSAMFPPVRGAAPEMVAGSPLAPRQFTFQRLAPCLGKRLHFPAAQPATASLTRGSPYRPSAGAHVAGRGSRAVGRLGRSIRWAAGSAGVAAG